VKGEDGGVFSSPSSALLFGGGDAASAVKNGWSYGDALNGLDGDGADKKRRGSCGDDDDDVGVFPPPRMDVAALVAAKRKTILESNAAKRNKKGKKAIADGASSSSSSNDDDDDDDSSSSSSADGDSDSDSDDDDDDDNVDPAEKDNEVDAAKIEAEEDVLKTRAGGDDDDDGSCSSSSDEDDDENDEDKVEARKAAAFFDNDGMDGSDAFGAGSIQMFSQLTLSRPILRGIAAMGYVTPTPIQAAVVPLALAGRDVCASAVTGSGKTAAFLLPLLERCLHLGGGHGQQRHIKALILCPTRELAAQCLGMLATLAQHTKLRACLICGGAKNLQAQAAELRSRPDLVIATPGRLLDHVTNTAGVNLDNVDFLVLDEADRLLDLGFQEEVHELIKTCPVNRQTLLFSATMNTKVDDLIRLSLKRPVRVRISSGNDGSRQSDVEVAPRLEQEFVRVRSGNEGINREGMLLALLSRTFTKHTIVFFDTKATAHRMMILCGLLGIKCAELHGNLSQKQRLQALEDFRQGNVDILLATDLAARGLDIDRVKNVINFEMPSSIETYVHRIGRTARAGRGGKSCTLAGEGRRYLMKELIKDAESKQKRGNKANKANGTLAGLIRSRTIPPAVVSHFSAKIKSLEPHVEEVLQAEEVARMDRLAEMEAVKAQNIIEHSDDIQARPRREWFASQSQKRLSKQAAVDKQRLIEEKAGTGMHRMTRKKRRAREAMQAMNAAMQQRNDDGGNGYGDSDEDGNGGAEGAQRRIETASAGHVKALARKKKKLDEAKERELAVKSINDMDMENSRKKKQKTKKGSSTGGGDFDDGGAFAAGDGNLFDEERVAHSRKNGKRRDGDDGDASPAKPAASHYQFRGYDASKKGKKKKSSVKSFKSRSKYKRRK